jgi:surfactin family lipopeptide synthetase A
MDVLPYISVPAWFEDQVRTTPEITAVVFDEKGLTYGELNRHANQLARRLEKLGVGPDKIVAVCLERSFDLIVSLLAILKAGGAYLPVDPALPRERQALMLDDAQPTVLITEQLLQAELPPVTAPVFIFDLERASLENENGEDVPGRVTGKNLAYVIYTSGSTGVPKGVEIAHEALVNFLVSMKERPGLTARDVVVAVTTFSFDIAGLEIFLPLVTGARLIFLSRDDAADGFRVLHHLKANHATVLQATPSTWRMLLDAKWPGDAQLKMLCGGEALPRELANQLLAKGGELWNMYGPTETTIWSSAAQVGRDDAPINIGGPIANTQLYILDAHLQPVPIGVPGELHIGGLGLARGYHNRPELTAERFVPDPFSGKPGSRLYKTGDLARFLPDGNIDCLGRLDHQVKIRGFRVELGEIEEVLNRHPGVQTSVVVAREDTPGDKRLTAYLVNRNGAASSSELREYLRVKLPDYMVPAAFVTLEALPLTPNGKVDRKALPKPDFKAIADQSKFVAPSTPTEIILAGIWCEVLGLKQVGIHDDFFELGGHSMLAVRLFTEIRKRFNINFGLSALFEARTVGALAELICKREADPSKKNPASAHALVPIRSRGTSTPLFLIHDVGGGVLRYEHLARHFPEDQAIYAIESRGLSGLPIDYSVETIARHYIQQIRERQPHGPYFVAGHCFGGLVTYEIARQLAAQKEPMGLVGLLDTFHRTVTEEDALLQGPLPKLDKLPIFKRLNKDIRTLVLGYNRIGYLRERKTFIQAWFIKTVYRTAYKFFSRFGWRMPRFLKDVKEANGIASDHFTPGTYDGTVVLFQCQNRIDTDPPDSSRIWQRLVRKAVILEVPGDHNSMLREPGVRVMAEQILTFMGTPSTPVVLPSSRRKGETRLSHDLERVS